MQQLPTEIENFWPVYGNDNMDYAYIPILKNAHTWATEFLKINAGFTQQVNPFNKSKFIIILRDPIKRWVSAVCTYYLLISDGATEQNLTRDILEDIFSKIILDSHGEPQMSYVFPLRVNQDCIFFNMDDINFENQFAHFVVNNLNPNLNNNYQKVPKYNDINNWSLTKHIKEQLDKALTKNIKYKNLLEKFYERDIKLYNTVKFYTDY